jgi:hypothetical protein
MADVNNAAADLGGAEEAAPDNSFGIMTARRWIFYGVFIFLMLIYLLIVPTFTIDQLNLTWVSISTMGLISQLQPIFDQDIAFVGDLVPGLLGAVIGGTAPKQANLKQILVILLVAIITYLAYVHLTAFFSLGPDGNLVDQDLDKELTREGINSDPLRTLADSSRNFTVFVISTIIGIQFSTSATNTAKIPMQPAAGKGANDTNAKEDDDEEDLDRNVPRQDESGDDISGPGESGKANG